MTKFLKLPFIKLLLLPLLLATALAQDDTIFTKVDEAPVAIKMPPPQYPESLKAGKVSGLVAVSAVIDENGKVIACEIVKATNDAFKQPALDAAKDWKFTPAKNGGKPVKVRVTLPVRFSPPA